MYSYMNQIMNPGVPPWHVYTGNQEMILCVYVCMVDEYIYISMNPIIHRFRPDELQRPE